MFEAVARLKRDGPDFVRQCQPLGPLEIVGQVKELEEKWWQAELPFGEVA